MKTIGLIGGMSWESTLEYYRIINESVNKRLGGFHSAKIVMYSVEFADIEKLQRSGQWDDLTDLMIDAARRVEKGGADFALIATNTMHLMADAVERNIAIPLLHIADVTAEAIKKKGISKTGLLGTKFTMEKDFYKEKLAGHGLEVITPSRDQREIVHSVIYEELCRGIIKESSRGQYRNLIEDMVTAGAEGVILGCTEIGLLIKDGDVSVPVFDTTVIHAEGAVDYALDA
jgi:aspartate racemase